MTSRRLFRTGIVALCLLLISQWSLIAAERQGHVTFAGLPLPGASVVATQGDTRISTTTDQDGVYRFADLPEGTWTIRVEMTGFAPLTKELTIGSDAALPALELALRPFADIAREAGPVNPPTASAGVAAGASTPAPPGRGTPASPAQSGGRSPNAAPSGGSNVPSRPALPVAGAGAAPANSGSPGPPASAAVPDAAPAQSSDAFGGASDGLLINGSVNNGAASPFAQAAGFGNNRPGQRSLYNGGIGVILGNSALDARPYSFGQIPAAKPQYTDVQFLGTFGGPIKIPGIRNRAQFFGGYQRTADTNATTQSVLMPTLRERGGDFSRTLDAFGQPVTILDPLTGQPFPDNVIPNDRLSPQALALLGYYPPPNTDGDGRYNYQRPLVTTTHNDNGQARLSLGLNARNQVMARVAYQRTTIEGINVFGFLDSTVISGVDALGTFSRRFSPFLSTRLQYQFTNLSNSVTPYFANRTNVSGEAGIGGNDQSPENWGPPALFFSSSLAGLNDAQFADNNNRTHAWNSESIWTHSRHNVTFGGDARIWQNNILSQQDPRGTFGFTGALTGHDFSDFLLGVPHTSSIAFGNADKFLRAQSYDAYVSDDWRVSPSFTVTAGLRWEYETPISETFNRLANLDIAPDFSSIASVVATDPEGTISGQTYPESLIRPDRLGFQPRLGIAWRPIPGSSLVVRGGYGIYRNTGFYQSIASLLAQQTPFSKTSSVENTPDSRLTLANGFLPPGPTSNTFAVDPNLRVGFAQNWQVSAQRDLPASLTIIATYFGTHGNHLLQEFVPNTYPLGATNPCPACPLGYVYLTSNGESNRHAAQLQVRRRLRNGLTATVQYTLARARDNAGAFTGVSLTGSAIAQDWLNPDAEWAPSNFDQRHLVTAQFQYTTGVGVAGGALLDGIKGSLFKGWTLTTDLRTGSGLSVTPVYPGPIEGTGVNGSIRADSTGGGNPPAGFYLDPAAYAAPQPGQWGNAGRNSGRGPAQFGLNAGISRSFLMSQRITLDWRLDANNVLNYVTFSSINSIFGSPQFGLPNRANTMRKLQSTIRVRF